MPLGKYKPGSTSITFKKFGPWQRANIALKTLPVELRSAAVWGQRKAAERYIKIVKGHIDNQDLGWIQLDASTESGDPRILVDTGAYRDAIKAWRSGTTYYAGVPKGAVNFRGVSIVDYATLHEHGWGNMPKRPLWEPSFLDMGGKAGIASIMTAAIFAKMTRLGASGFTVTKRGGKFNITKK